jgi:hypothetical protein
LHIGAHFPCGLKSATDERIFRVSVQRKQAIAVLAVELNAIAHIVCTLPEYPAAARAPDLDLVVNHA